MESLGGLNFQEAATRCPEMLRRMKALLGMDYAAVLEPLEGNNPVGTNVDGLWLTFYGEHSVGGVRHQGTLVYTIKTGQICGGYWRDGDETVSYRCSQEGMPPPPMKAWIEDEN